MVSRQSSDGLESPAQDVNHRITTSHQDHHRHCHCHQHHHHHRRHQAYDLHCRITTTHQSNLNQGRSAKRKYSMKWDKFWKGKYLIKMGNNTYENLNSNISMTAGNGGLCSSSPNPSPSTQRRRPSCTWTWTRAQVAQGAHHWLRSSTLSPSPSTWTRSIWVEVACRVLSEVRFSELFQFK